MPTYRKVTEFKTVADFRAYLASEAFDIPLADDVTPPVALNREIDCMGRRLSNRWAILPMEGWDCEADGTPSELTARRWLRFAASGAKLIYGTEAAAVMHEGRSNPCQLVAAPHTAEALRRLCSGMRELHREKFGSADDLLIGLQLTHSGRYAHPNRSDVLESVTAFSHPLLDVKFGSSPANVIDDKDIPEIIRHYVVAAKVARDAGFDFVDVKQAHGYLGHEFLAAHTRPGQYGGSFENRTRFFREIADGIRDQVPDIRLSSRVSLFDIRPFVRDPETGIGRAMAFTGDYREYSFGSTADGMDMDLSEPARLIRMMRDDYGVDLICATIGSPYYNVHMQRPAYYPVCDGYMAPEHPLFNVARHLKAVREIRKLCPSVAFVGSGYSCLQEYIVHAAERAVADGAADFAGIGRMVLSYPELCADCLAGKPLERRRICRTFGDCTNAPRNGMVSGCYPLDDFYKKRAEALKLKELKLGWK